MVSGRHEPSGFAVLARADEDKLGADRIAEQPLRRLACQLPLPMTTRLPQARETGPGELPRA